MALVGNRTPHWMVALAWLVASGCAGCGPLLPAFWSRPSTPPPPQAGPPPNQTNGPAPPGHPTPAAPGPGPNGAVPPSASTAPTPERLADLMQRLAGAEDERKALAARVQLLETALEEKDKALAQASKEIQGTRDEVTRTRTEWQRQKQEIGEVRNRLRNSEKENLATLQSIVSTLEHMAERDKPAEGKREPGSSEPNKH